jgi:hypothetical protein
VDEYQKGDNIGFIDLLIFDILILLAIPQSLSVAIKMCVTFGSIISVLVGFILTLLSMRLMKLGSMPCIPLPVMIASIYLFFLDIIMPNASECVGLNNNRSVLSKWIVY